MGYKRKILHLTFQDEPELEFYIRSVSVRRALRLMRLAGEMGADGKSEEQSQKDVEELFGAFAERVVSWTLVEDEPDEDGNEVPVPVSLESLMDWDFSDALPWVLAWIQRATSIAVPTTAPAQQETPAGAPIEASIPMASPSGM